MSDVVTSADAARAAIEASSGGPAVAIITAYTSNAMVRRRIIRADGTVTGSLGDARLDEPADEFGRALLETDAGPQYVAITLDGIEYRLLIEAHSTTDSLIIVGAGHIAVPLARLGAMLGFRVTVLDDREDMATPDRFDDAVTVIRTNFATDPFASVQITGNSYIALVTRGHRWDYDCLHRIVESGVRPRYLGMIGSRRRVRAAFRALLESGVSRDVLATIRAPIGLELNAETPVEIAVAICSEIVAVRRGSDIASISSRERVLDRFLHEKST